MNYFLRMKRLLTLDGTVYEEIFNQNMALRYCVVNVLIAGLIYSVSSIQFSKMLLKDSNTLGQVGFNPIVVIMVGMSVAFLMHAGAALFIWVFCRGIGGCPQFMIPYLNLGIASIIIWPLAPAFSALSAGITEWPLYVYTAIVSVYALRVGYISVKCASGLSDKKMIIAAVATLIYVGCFLYLWM